MATFPTTAPFASVTSITWWEMLSPLDSASRRNSRALALASRTARSGSEGRDPPRRRSGTRHLECERNRGAWAVSAEICDDQQELPGLALRAIYSFGCVSKRSFFRGGIHRSVDGVAFTRTTISPALTATGAALCGLNATARLLNASAHSLTLV